MGKTNLFNSIKGRKTQIPDGILAAVLTCRYGRCFTISPREAAETRPRYWVGCFPPGSTVHSFFFSSAKVETTINGKGQFIVKIEESKKQADP